jgi:hypothetical protein
VIPEADMPFTKDGIRPDIIVNPHAVPTRMTVGQLIECLTGKACVLQGSFGDSTAYNSNGTKIGEFAEILAKHNYHSSGNEILYDGATGQQMESEIFIGPTFYMRLKHMVKDKIIYRTQGPRTALTRQPVSGRANDGGLRIGEMERDGLIAHGATNMLTESMMERGDKYYMAVCNKSGMIAVYNPDKNLFLSPMADGPLKFTGSLAENNMAVENVSKFGRDFSVVRVPYSLKLLIQELQCANVVMRIITEDNIEQIENMTFSKNINILLGEKEVDMKKYIDDMHKKGDKTGVRKEINDEIVDSPEFAPRSPVYVPISPDYAEGSPDYVPRSPVYAEGSPVYVPRSPDYAEGSPVYVPRSPVYAPDGTPVYNPQSPEYAPGSPAYPPDGMPVEEFQGSLSNEYIPLTPEELKGGRGRDYEIGDLVCKNGKQGEVFCVTKKGNEFLTIEKQTNNMPTLDDLQVVDRSEISRYQPQQMSQTNQIQQINPMQQMQHVPFIPPEPKSAPDVNITLVTGNNNKVTGGEQTKKTESSNEMKEPISIVSGGSSIESNEKKEESSSGILNFAKSFFIKKTG